MSIIYNELPMTDQSGDQILISNYKYSVLSLLRKLISLLVLYIDGTFYSTSIFGPKVQGVIF